MNELTECGKATAEIKRQHSTGETGEAQKVQNPRKGVRQAKTEVRRRQDQGHQGQERVRSVHECGQCRHKEVLC